MGTGRKKIEIKRRNTSAQRMVAFSKRRAGLFKKITELYSLTGAEIAAIAFSPAGKPYTHGEPSFNATMDRFRAYIADDDDDDNYHIVEFKSLLDAIQVDGFENRDELLLLKQRLEEICGMLTRDDTERKELRS